MRTMPAWNGDRARTGWVTPTLSSPFTYFNSETVRYQRVGDIVFLVGAVTRNAAADGATVFTLPAGYRPANPGGWRFMNDTNPNSTTSMRCVIETNGQVRLYEKVGAFNSAYLHTSFIAEQ